MNKPSPQVLLLLMLVLVTLCFGQNPNQMLNHFTKAELFYKTYQYDSAYVEGKKAFELASQKKTHDSTWLKAGIIAELSALRKKIPDSTNYMGQVLEMAYKKQKPGFIIEAEFGKATQLFLQRLYPEALERYLKIDSIASLHGIENDITLSSLLQRSEISRLTFTPQAVNAAYDMALEALKRGKKINAQNSVNDAYMRLADLSGLRELYDDAKKYADSALTFFTKENDTRKVSRIYWIYTSYYTVTNQPEKVEEHHLKRIAFLNKTNDAEETASALVAYANYLQKVKKDCNKALPLFQKAKNTYDALKENENDRYLRLLLGMAACEAGLNNFKSAYELYDQAYGIKVAISNKTNSELTRELETKYQTEKKEQEIALLTAQKELEAKQKANQRNLFLALLGVILIASGFIFYAYRNKLKTTQKLKELDTLKSRFFANISHEFRTPLTLIKSPLQSVMEAETSEEKTQKLQLVNQNANRMLELVDQLLELSKLDSGSLKPILKKADLDAFIKTLIAPFRFEAEQKNIPFSSHININPKEHWFDRDILEKITGNLLSNALKYTPENEKVHVAASAKNHWLKIQVQNTGNTLSKAETSKIFERFYQKNEINPGVGIGLALVKELVELYKGSIDVENQQGTLTFNVMLPLDKEILKDVAIISEDAAVEVPTVSTVTPEEDAPLLLIADDNAAIRQVVADIFASEYKILEALNGKEALKIAKKEVPDLIISDVMMPEMDGFELTNALKNDEVTSFVPVVLLTAKTGDEAHLQALKNQADAYVTKPFNNQVLKATVQQLLAERSKLRERFSKELVLRPMDVVLNSADEKFLDKLQTIIDGKLQNPDFSAEEFADTVGMSRMQLHRKLKSLTGFSATEFIRKERLKMAATLLKNKSLNVSEVAFAVGFNDADYFTKCFKEEFGVTPSRFS